MGPSHRQLLAAGEGAGVQRHPVLGHPHTERAAAHDARVHRSDAAGHHPGHRRRRQPHPGCGHAARGGRAHEHRVHGVGAREELLADLLDAVHDAGDRRRVPLVGGEPEPAAQGADRPRLLQGRRPAQAQGRLDAARVVPVLLGLLPADVLGVAGQADQHGRRDPPHHPRRGRARYYIGYKYQRGLERVTEAEREELKNYTFERCSSCTTTRSSTRRTCTTRSVSPRTSRSSCATTPTRR